MEVVDPKTPQEAKAVLAAAGNAIQIELGMVETKIRRFERLSWTLVIIGILLTAPAAAKTLSGEIKLADAGSYLSGVGAVFSLAGFIFVYVAFLGQRKQFLLQEQQIAQGQYQINTNRLDFESQRAEVTFFQLLQKYHDIVTTLSLTRKDSLHGLVRVAEGRGCFEVLYRRFRDQVDDIQDIERVKVQYNLFFEFHTAALAHYFGHLHQLLIFLKSTDGGSSMRLSTFLRAQLSSYELLLLFYHALQDTPQCRSLKSLLEEFQMISGLPDGMLLRQNHRKWYDDSAFKS